MSAESLTGSELLLLESRQSIERGRDQQHDGGRDQACRVADQGEPLDQAHDSIDSSAHVICFEAANEAVEDFRGWADAEEERDFDEDEDEGGDAVRWVVSRGV